MSIKKSVVNIIFWSIIGIVLITMFLGYRSCHSNAPVADSTVIGTKVTIAPEKPSTTIINKPTEVSSKVPAKPVSKPIIRDYDSLLDAFRRLETLYNDLYVAHYTEHTYRDTARGNDSSYVVSESWVTQNTLQNQLFDFHPYSKTIETYIEVYKPRRQLYFNYGGGVDYLANKYAIAAAIGFTYKDRRDRVYTANIEANTWQQVGIKLIRSGKISFRK